MSDAVETLSVDLTATSTFIQDIDKAKKQLQSAVNVMLQDITRFSTGFQKAGVNIAAMSTVITQSVIKTTATVGQQASQLNKFTASLIKYQAGAGAGWAKMVGPQQYSADMAQAQKSMVGSSVAIGRGFLSLINLTRSLRGELQATARVSFKPLIDELVKANSAASHTAAAAKAAANGMKKAVEATNSSKKSMGAGWDMWAQVFNPMQNSIMQVGQGITALGQSITAHLVRPLLVASTLVVATIGGIGIAAIKMGVEYNSAIESATTSFTVMLKDGEAAKKMIKEIGKFAADTPLSMAGSVQAGTTLLQFGAAAQSILPTLNQLADVTAGDEQRFKSMALAFGQMTAAGRLMGQDLLQMINAGFNPLKEISDRTGESMASLKKRMEAGAISSEEVAHSFKMATAEGGQFFNMALEKSKTLGGQWGILKDGLARATGAMFAAVSTSLKSTMENLNKYMDSGHFSQWTKSMATEIGAIISELSKLVGMGGKGGFASVADAILAVVKQGVPLVQWVRGTATEIATLYEYIKPLVDAVISWSVANPALAGSLVLAAAAMGPMISMAGSAITLFGQLKAATIALAGAQKAAALGTAALKAGLAGLAVGGIAVLAYSVYQGNTAIKALNEQLAKSHELQNEMGQGNSSRFGQQIQDLEKMDAVARKDELAKAIERTKRELEGAKSGLRGSTAEVERLNTTWRSMTGNKILAIQKGQMAESAQSVKDYKGQLAQLIDMQKKVAEEEKHIADAKAGIKAPNAAGGGAANHAGDVDFKAVGSQKALAEAIAETTADMKEQLAVMGLSGAAHEIYKLQRKAEELGLKELSAAQKEGVDLLQKQIEAKRKLTDDSKHADEYIKDMQAQALYVGKTGHELELYKIQLSAATDAQKDAAVAANATLVFAEKDLKLKDKSKTLIEQNRSANDKAIDTQRELKEMLDKGYLTLTQYNKALLETRKHMSKDLTLKMKITGIDAVEAGSAEALARMAEYLAHHTKMTDAVIGNNKRKKESSKRHGQDDPEFGSPARPQAQNANWEKAANNRLAAFNREHFPANRATNAVVDPTVAARMTAIKKQAQVEADAGKERMAAWKAGRVNSDAARAAKGGANIAAVLAEKRKREAGTTGTSDVAGVLAEKRKREAEGTNKMAEWSARKDSSMPASGGGQVAKDKTLTALEKIAVNTEKTANKKPITMRGAGLGSASGS